MEFWQTRGGIEFQYKLLLQLTRIADGIEAQNGLYERLLPPDEDVPELVDNCDKCHEDKCQPFNVKSVWLHDDDGNDTLQHCRCSCSCHVERELAHDYQEPEKETAK
jgi:hypothetical protein